MQKVLTAEQMRAVDRLTTERFGIPSILLMENAAHAVARVITEKLGDSVKGKSVLILCGKGNNGGDGAALARILWTQGAEVSVVLFGSVDEIKGDARINFDNLRSISKFRTRRDFEEYDKRDVGRILFHEERDGEYFRKRYRPISNPDVVVDAIFGTGLSRKLDENIYQVIVSKWFDEPRDRESPFLLISMDIPTGLMVKTWWAPEINFKADITVTFTAPKLANVLPPASAFNGELILADIGSPAELINEVDSKIFVSEREDVQGLLQFGLNFDSDSYKNKRGHTLVIAGSEDYSGAAVLCGNAAMRSGVGLVTVVTPSSSKDSVTSRVLPEVMVRGASKTENGAISEAAFDEIDELLEKANSIAIGCGLSQDASTKAFVEKVIENRRQPTIVDADALNLLSPFAGSLQEPARSKGIDGPPLILTPHEGEFMRLLGTGHKDAIKDRVAAVRDFAVKHNVILVLKGERVLIGAPDGRVVVNPTGNSGLGKAGNGDTLAGILAGFVAQAVQFKIDTFETVVAAVYVAGMAGDIAERKYGKRVMTASDVRECLADVFAELES